MLSFVKLIDNKVGFLAATGLMPEEFDRLLAAFKVVYAAATQTRTWEGQARVRAPGAGRTSPFLKMDEDKLFFVLVCMKSNLLQAVQGASFGMSQPTANLWIHRLLPQVREAQASLRVLPTRTGSEVATHPITLEGKEGTEPAKLSIDGSERPRQRPSDDATQRAHYSGKSKTHADKNLVVVNQTTKRIAYLGPTEPGSMHDKKAAERADILFPSEAHLYKDTGFQAYEPVGTQTHQPKKKPPKKELTEEEKTRNRDISRVRVRVEHAIGGMKRLRIVKDILRMTKEGISDLLAEIAAGMHNLRVAFRTLKSPPELTKREGG